MFICSYAFWFQSDAAAAGAERPPLALLQSRCVVLPTGGPGVFPGLVPAQNQGHSSRAALRRHGPPARPGLLRPHEQL